MPIEVPGIQSFYDAARHTDFARDFQFRIVQLGSNQYSQLFQDELIFMTTASLPNRSINNQPVPFMGLQFNVPGSVTYTGSDAWNVTFRMPQDYSLRTILEGWQINTFDEQTSTGDYSIPARDSVIVLALLNNAGQVIRDYTLYGVYVVALGEVAYDLKGTGTPIEFSATLAYQYWQRTKTLRGNIAVPLNPPGSAPVNTAIVS